MKKLIYLLLVASTFGCSHKTASKYSDYPISVVDIKNVVINDSFWLPKIKVIQDSTIQYAFDKCYQEGRMENFLIAGKKKSGKTRGKMPFDDTDLYKIIEGASNTLISKPNATLDAYLDSVISIIKTGQEPDGYVTTWFTIDRKNPPAWWVKPSTKRWENEISSHELYNSGHLFEAATTHYLATGKRNFLDIAIKNADLLVANFGPDKLRTPPGHQIVETGLIKLYRITKNEKYLQLAKFLLDVRGDSTSHKLYGAYNQDHIPVVKQSEAVGHAVRAEYMYAAMTDIAALYHDSAYLKAVMNIWDNTVTKKTYITGGVGARHEGESFGDNYELPNLTAYNETCAAIGSVYWNQCMFLLTGDAKYFDIIERTLYNGLISGMSLDGKKFFYPNPLEADGKFKFNQGASTRSPWFDCSCCPTNMIRFLPSIPNLIYATKDDRLFINLYIANHATMQVGNQTIGITQQTAYPWKGNVSMMVNPEKKSTFSILMRIPGWVQNQAMPGDLYFYTSKIGSPFKILVNGKDEPVNIANGFAEITREWSKGDKVELLISMTVHRVLTNKSIKDDLNKVAFEYGPMVYCAEESDNKGLMDVVLPIGESLIVSEATLLQDKTNVLKGNISGKTLTLIPYYLWSNRGVGKMKVWFPVKGE